MMNNNLFAIISSGLTLNIKDEANIKADYMYLGRSGPRQIYRRNLAIG